MGITIFTSENGRNFKFGEVRENRIKNIDFEKINSPHGREEIKSEITKMGFLDKIWEIFKDWWFETSNGKKQFLDLVATKTLCRIAIEHNCLPLELNDHVFVRAQLKQIGLFSDVGLKNYNSATSSTEEKSGSTNFSHSVRFHIDGVDAGKANDGVDLIFHDPSELPEILNDKSTETKILFYAARDFLKEAASDFDDAGDLKKEADRLMSPSAWKLCREQVSKLIKDLPNVKAKNEVLLALINATCDNSIKHLFNGDDVDLTFHDPSELPKIFNGKSMETKILFYAARDFLKEAASHVDDAGNLKEEPDRLMSASAWKLCREQICRLVKNFPDVEAKKEVLLALINATSNNSIKYLLEGPWRADSPRWNCGVA